MSQNATSTQKKVGHSVDATCVMNKHTSGLVSKNGKILYWTVT